METTDKVLEAIKQAGELVNAGKVAELTGIDRKEVDKAMNKLKADGAIESPKRCFWQPKK
jgi:biotin operon repressor